MYNLIFEYFSKHSDSAYVIAGSLSEDVESTCLRLITEAVEHWGKLDLLVNNASAFSTSPEGGITEQSWDYMMNTNLKAPVFLAQVSNFYLEKIIWARHKTT